MTEESSFKLMITNQSNKDRIIRTVIAVILIGVNLYLPSSFNAFITNSLLVVAAALLFNAISGNCYVYRILGYSSCPLPEAK